MSTGPFVHRLNFTDYFGVSANLAQWLTSGATLVSGIIIPVTAFPILLISRLVQAVGPTYAGLMLVGILTLVLFAHLQLTSEKPMLNLWVFTDASFRIAVVISICLYMISMGSGIILPILTKSICGFSDSSYGYATLFGSILAVFTTSFAGSIYDKMGIRPMFVIGVLLFAGYAVMGVLFTQNTGI